MKRYATKPAQARQRRRLQAQERLKHQRAQAQPSIAAIHQALKALDGPDTLVAEIAGRVQAQQKLLGTIVGLRLPTLFGCRHGHERTRVRGWNKTVPSRLLGARPTRSWLTRLRRVGLAIRLAVWRHPQAQSASTPSRWPWRGRVDAAVFRTDGKQLGRVGPWDRGQLQRTGPGSDGVLLLGVMGEGKRLIPLDFASRRPHPQGPGRRGHATLTVPQHRLDERWAACANRGVTFPVPMVVAESWCSDAKCMRHSAPAHQGTLRVQGKRS